MTTSRKAAADGRCDCCQTPYLAGAALHVEFEKYLVLDVHPLPRIAPVKRRWPLHS